MRQLELTSNQKVNSRYTSPQYFSLCMMVNHSVGDISVSAMPLIQSQRTIRLALGKHLRQINFRLPNQVWFAGVVRVARQCQELAALHLRRSLAIALRRRWRGVCPRNMWQVVDILIEFKADLFVPLRVLPATLDCLCAPLLPVEDDLTERILLAYVTLVWQVPLAREDAW